MGKLSNTFILVKQEPESTENSQTQYFKMTLSEAIMGSNLRLRFKWIIPPLNNNYLFLILFNNKNDTGGTYKVPEGEQLYLINDIELQKENIIDVAISISVSSAYQLEMGAYSI